LNCSISSNKAIQRIRVYDFGGEGRWKMF
jgi:hypothetical protein